MALTKKIAQIQQELADAITRAQTAQELEQIRITFLGRKGSIATLMDELKTLSLEEKKAAGPAMNALKQFAQDAHTQREQELLRAQRAQELEKFKHFDVTVSRPESLKGNLHLYTKITEHVENIFMSMGYEIADGPEVETGHRNFTALNIPHDHPARDMHDTFWLPMPDMLLRTHTSSVQVHAMETRKPPLAIAAPGRCYRNEATDASHDFMFTQAECLFIDKNVSMSNLIATAKTFLQKLFDCKTLNIRVRPGYFPFVEPGIEIDASCPFCTKGCSTCKHTTWIELLGAGLIHPNVLRASGLDPQEYSGFAFGMGLERLTMVKHGISDIRAFHRSPLSFIDQF